MPRATVQKEVASAPLSKDQLVGFFESGCKPKSKWRIGTEHEKFAFKMDDLTRAGYPEIQHVLDRLVSRFGWSPIMEGDKIIGCKRDGQSVTLEPGGQFELSGAPLANLHQTCDEVQSHLYQAKTISEELNVGFLGLGFDPKWKFEDIPRMPKDRYKIMRNYMPKVGTLGLDMMFRSCTIQVNLDFESEQDMIEKFRIGLALQPITTALFEASPFKEGKLSGYNSWRGNVWTDVDNARCGNLPFVFDDGFSFEAYADWALDVPMYFAYRNGEYLDATGQSFRDFMTGDLAAAPGEIATMADWETHLSTVFPDVRLKKFLEMRGADGGPWSMICALPAFWVGLIYDDQAQAECLDMISGWTVDEMTALREEVPRDGLRTKFRNGTAADVAAQALAISRGGLERRGLDEVKFLRRLEQIVEAGESQADVLLRLYESEWERSVDPVYDYMAF